MELGDLLLSNVVNAPVAPRPNRKKAKSYGKRLRENPVSFFFF